LKDIKLLHDNSRLTLLLLSTLINQADISYKCETIFRKQNKKILCFDGNIYVQTHVPWWKLLFQFERALILENCSDKLYILINVASYHWNANRKWHLFDIFGSYMLLLPPDILNNWNYSRAHATAFALSRPKLITHVHII
jgi:hypothetical protein